jgi:allantoate deiminase
MESAGLSVSVDAMGNLHGFRGDPGMPRLLIGSHIDTVPDAGRYDGVLGVLIAIALAEASQARNLPFAIEVIAFSEEEGVRFGVPFLGSRALAGTVDAHLLSLRDKNGVSVEDAIRAFGLDPAKLADARLNEKSFAYLEFHIEQGPVLEQAGLSLAAVEAIAGQSRVELIFSGSANHAGTTPMDSRHDALAGAAEWLGAVEAQANRTDGLVATVGRLQVFPGASNVIPGEVHASLDVRHALDATRRAAVEALLDSAKAICTGRKLGFTFQEKMDQQTVHMNKQLVAAAERAIAAAGEKPKRMTSGAGHDAMILASVVPSVMIFLRSIAGISHHPSEAVHAGDVEKAILAGINFLEELARTL